jgi:SAM-dependent methyltransferase
LTDALPLDDPGREAEIREKILGKPGLKDWYLGIYRDWAALLGATAPGGLAVELGAGAGFANAVIPELLRTDTLAYPGVDQVADALAMPWKDGEIRAIFMLNVMHHLPDAAAFLREAQRVLKPGGLAVITDPHIGILSRWPYRWHHEPMDVQAKEWAAPVEHALAGANSALTWIIFMRDRARFEREFPDFRLEAYRPFSPLQYWLSGGLKRWSLVPGFAVPLARGLDRLMLMAWPDTASFCHVVLRKRAG